MVVLHAGWLSDFIYCLNHSSYSYQSCSMGINDQLQGAEMWHLMNTLFFYLRKWDNDSRWVTASDFTQWNSILKCVIDRNSLILQAGRQNEKCKILCCFLSSNRIQCFALNSGVLIVFWGDEPNYTTFCGCCHRRLRELTRLN